MKRLLLSITASLSLLCVSAVASAQDSSEPSGEQLEQMGELFAGLFTSEPLTEEQESRLPKATALVDVMMPEGFYAQMMSEIMTGTMGPMLEMMSGAQGAEIVMGSRLNIDPEVTAALSVDEKTELATLLDPSFSERGNVMQGLMNTMMVEVATLIEPGFKQGMANAYAIRFDAAQLDDIAGFFATPTGALYARENIKLMADPQVMSASMQAMPAMMQQFGDIGAELEAVMAALPPERDVSDLSDEQRARMSQLLGVDAASLEDVVSPIIAADNEGE